MSKKKLLLIIFASIGVVAVALVAVCATLFGTICATQVGPAQDVVAEFMLAGQARDTDSALELWVPEIERDELESLIEDNYVYLFKHYESLSLHGWHISSSGDITRVKLEGSIIYTDDSKISYEAELVKISGEWKLYNIQFGY